MRQVDDAGDAAASIASRGVGRAELFVTVFIVGAMIMTIEVVGTRIVGPVFGVGLFVWSALLAVTLGALAFGYYGGGVLADRIVSPRLLGIVVTGAGVLLSLVPLLSHAVLASAETFGPRAGALFSAAMLFAPALVALGMTGPIAVKLATKSLLRAGRTIGSVYAVSTAGSLAGTLIVGFELIPAFDAHAILGGAACLLMLLGAASVAWRKWPAALGVLIWPVLLGGAPESRLPSGITIADRSQSLLGLVEVIADDNRGVKFLRSDHSILGAEFVRDGSSGFSFVNVLEAIRFLRPAATSLLEIGLGTGVVPSALGRQGIKVDVAEIDPAVVRFAEQDFGFAPTGDVYIEDARTFLRRTGRRYDLVVHDTFTGGTTPDHLLSLEVLQRIHSVLRPNGALALNFAGYYDGVEAQASYAVARTVRAVFRNVRAFRDSAPKDAGERIGNIIFFASDGSLDFRIPDTARFDNRAGEKVQRSFQAWEVMQNVPAGPLITDARNPLGRLQLPIAEKHFAAMNELLPAEVWLH